MVNNKVLAEQFVKGATKGKGSSMFIEGDSIYSYGYHFPVAVRTPNGFLFNVDGYSQTTAKHKSNVRSALMGQKVYEGRTEDLKNLPTKNVSAETLQSINSNTQKYVEQNVKARVESKKKLAKFKRALKKGTEIEKREHPEFSEYDAQRIARDHLNENPDYYKKEPKTEKEFVVQGNYGQGYEDVTSESTRKDARQRLGEYNENERQYAHRIVMRRVPSHRRGSQRHSRSSSRTKGGAL